METVTNAILAVLSYPVVLCSNIFANIVAERAKIAGFTAMGGSVTSAMIWDQSKWFLLALLIFIIVFILIYDTIRRVFLTDEDRTPHLIRDLAMAGAELCLYYATLSFILFVIFDVIVPIARTL